LQILDERLIPARLLDGCPELILGIVRREMRLVLPDTPVRS